MTVVFRFAKAGSLWDTLPACQIEIPQAGSVRHYFLTASPGKDRYFFGSKGDYRETIFIRQTREVQPLFSGYWSRTHALSADSLAINHGSNSTWLDWDQRGFPYSRSYGGVDIVAFERQPDPNLPMAAVATAVRDQDGAAFITPDKEVVSRDRLPSRPATRAIDQVMSSDPSAVFWF